jgi:5'-phosphate synthase pdxT subunit
VKAGVLALQGDFREHAAAFSLAGATPIEVRTPTDLADVDCLAIPGGESTTIGLLARSAGLVAPIRDRAAAGMPILGTCAGMIVLAREVEGGEPLLGLLDATVRRNAYGRQNESFETDVAVRGIDAPVRAVFIRAPVVERVGPTVAVLAEHGGRPVVIEQGNLVAAAFHPELVGEARLHAYVLGKV